MVRKTKKTNFMLFAIVLLFAIFFGWVSGGLFASSDVGRERLLIDMWVYSFLSLVLHVTLSLLGSAFLGLSQGMSFVSINLFGFELVKENDRYKFVKNKTPGFIGTCWLKPRDRDERFQYEGFYLGGIAVTIVSLFICLLIGSQSIFSYSFIIVGIIMLISSISPFTNNGVNMVKTAKKSAKEEELLYSNLMAHSQLVSGKTFLELDDTCFFSLSNEKNFLLDYQILLKIGRAYEEEDFYMVRNLLNDCWYRKDSLVKPIEIKVKKELLFYLLIFEPKDDRISMLISDSKVQKSLKHSNVTNNRIKAAIAYYEEGASEKVLSLLDEGIDWNKEVPNLGVFQLEQKGIKKMRSAWF
ncbi:MULTISPECIES: hypothetical protein [Vagococcus]|uniref:hypothetical protein n=1 Tax=Vagococcus TaxID=2737 RepID=UPI002FCAB348